MLTVSPLVMFIVIVVAYAAGNYRGFVTGSERILKEWRDNLDQMSKAVDSRHRVDLPDADSDEGLNLAKDLLKDNTRG